MLMKLNNNNKKLENIKVVATAATVYNSRVISMMAKSVTKK